MNAYLGLLLMVLGALVLTQFLPWVARGGSVRVARSLRRSVRSAAAHVRHVWSRDGELGGYVHDAHMSKWIPANLLHFVTGTWTQAAGAVANTICMSKAAADNTAVVTIPITPPQNSVAGKGSYVKSIDIYWEVLTAAMDAVTPVIYKASLPADTAAFAAPSSLAFSYDAGHDTAAKRLTLDQHKMTLTLTTPIWLDDDDVLTVQVTMDAAATSALTVFGARANYTARL